MTYLIFYLKYDLIDGLDFEKIILDENHMKVLVHYYLRYKITYRTKPLHTIFIKQINTLKIMMEVNS